MKALRNLTHDGNSYPAGTVFTDNPFSQQEHDNLVNSGVISDNDQTPLPVPVDLQYLNYLIQEGDAARERVRKLEDQANRAANIGVPSTPVPQTSQVEQGTKEDAAQAVAKANAAAANTPASGAAPAAANNNGGAA